MDKDITVEQLIEKAVSQVDDSFSAYDVTQKVHELIRHNELRSLVHEYLAGQVGIERVSDRHSSNGQSFQAFSYKKKFSQPQKRNDKTVFPTSIPDGTKVFLVELENSVDPILAIIPDKDWDRDEHTILANYPVSSGEVSVSSYHFDDYFPNGYNVYYEGNTIFIEEK